MWDALAYYDAANGDQAPLADPESWKKLKAVPVQIVADPEIEAAMRHGEPQEIIDRLVTLTLERGAHDNVTVCAVDAE